jgi:hypothetical protein
MRRLKMPKIILMESLSQVDVSRQNSEPSRSRQMNPASGGSHAHDQMKNAPAQKMIAQRAGRQGRDQK